MKNDLINRTAALEAIDSVLVEDESCKVWFRLALQNLPPAQPEIIRCRECKLRDTEYCNMAHGFMGMKDDDYCSYAERREVSE